MIYSCQNVYTRKVTLRSNAEVNRFPAETFYKAVHWKAKRYEDNIRTDLKTVA
jgi:hypothetical protein